MKRINYILALIICLFINGNLNAQSFPAFWNDDQYDISKGSNGFIRLINQNGESLDNVNKVYSISTIIDSQKKDLFRVTSQGVSTLSSPNSSFDVKLDFYRGGVWNGYIRGGSDQTLNLRGSHGIHIKGGEGEEMDLMNITNDDISAYRMFRLQNNNMFIKKNNIEVRLGINDAQRDGWIGTSTANGLYLGTGGYSAMYLGTDKNVYIGCGASDVAGFRQALKDKYNLFVYKGILSNDYGFAPVSTWSDFVFEKYYHLPDIRDVERFINKNKHLPEVPSVKQVSEEGYSQHEMNRVLLQKIEELTLYTIKQQNEIDLLKSQLTEKDK